MATLPGGAGVTLDYEIFNPATPDRLRGHIEHTMVGRTHDGGAVMVIGHAHAASVAILAETEPGTFELRGRGITVSDEGRVTIPEPGSSATRGGTARPATPRSSGDVAELTRVD